MRLTMLAGLLLCVAAPAIRAQGGTASSDAAWTRVRWEAFGLVGTYRLHAPDGPARGLVVLIGAPDAGLPALLRDEGIATMEPEVRPWTLFLAAREQKELETAVLHAVARLGLPPGRVVAGGVSLGGTGAVRFIQQCLAAGCGPATPVAVFAVDAPLDMERVWRATNAVIQRGAPESNLVEARELLERLTLEFGGPPGQSAAAYLARSPFSYFERRGGNARYLIETPVRLYAEPDMDYWIGQRRYDYYTINAFDAAAMVNQLRILGNTAAELVITRNRGYGADGSRNPHAWSIVDEPELVAWILGHLR